MLDSMRLLAKGFVAKALMAFLVLSFAIWGIGDVVRNHGTGYLVKVGSEVITPAQYMARQRDMQRQFEQAGLKIDTRALGQQILQSMVQERLVDQWRRKTGFAVNDATLAKVIAKMPQFQDITGKFDPKQFHEQLARMGLSEQGFRQQVSQEIAGKAILAGLDTAGLKPSPSILELSAIAGTQTRDAVIITVAPQAATVSDADIESYYEQHKNEYAQPETRTLDYVVLDRATLGGDDAVQEKGTAVEDALAGGGGMADALKQAGINAPVKTLSNVTAAQTGDVVLKTVTAQGFELGEGESSGLIPVDANRYAMVSVKKVTPEAPRPLEQVKAQVRSEAAKENAQADSRARVQQIKEAINGGMEWQKAAASAKASARPVSQIARPVIAADGSVKSASGSVPPLLAQAIFEREPGSVAGPLMRENGEQVLALVTAVRTEKSATPAAGNAANAQYASEMNQTTLSALLRMLMEDYGVKINQDVMRQLQATNE